MFLALKEMKKEKGRFILIIGIVILISYLVFFLTGLAYGLAKDNTTAVENWNADKIVLKAGTNSNLASSMMEKEVIEDFKDYEISPINLSRAVAYKNGSETDKNTIDLVLVGLDKGSKAYPKIIEGNEAKNKNQVIASISLKKEDDVQIGDKLVLSLNDKEYEVVGFTEESKYNVGSVIYTELYEASSTNMMFTENEKDANQNKAEEKNGEKPNNSKAQDADAVSKATNTVPERVAGILIHGQNDLKSNEKYDVITMDDFIKELPGYIAQVLTFGLMIGFLILISTIVLGVFMYIITIQKKQTFGIMKVQGISNKYIANSVITQTFLVSLIGVLMGLGLTLISELLLPQTVPFKSNYIFYLIIAVLIVVISMLGAIFSVRGVTKVDPLEVLE
ncbi:ABC transporter permease [Helcococcus kunzii]|uniref:ABC transporter permease n=1 Tax=Helcococcus kunzii TaxID=40091 RepID=UPI0024AE63C5|nr:ABC transporter permease [Helcococcus kunzii]